MNELKTKTEKTTDGAPKRNPWRRLPKGGKIAVIVVGILAVLAVLAALYVNGKLDLLRYDDGSVSEMGEIGADEDQDLDGTGLTHTESEMTMPEGSPFSDDNVLNILLVGTDERTEAVNDADAFTHLNQLDGTEDTTEFSDDARSDSMILVSLDIKDHVIRLVSIERGTGVPILLDGYEGQYDWITHTFRYGGAKLTMKTIEDCFNVQVDHYVRVNFNSFVQIVDAVGGVELPGIGPPVKPAAHIGQQGPVVQRRFPVRLGQLTGHPVVVPALGGQLGLQVCDKGVVAHLLGERRIDQDNIVVVQCLHGQGQDAVILIIADVLLEKRAAAVIRLPGNLEDLLGEDDERVLVEVDNVL